MAKIEGCNLIMKASEMEDRAAWLKLRNKGLGGSDAGIIVGVNPWKSPYQLWLEKTGQVEPEDISEKEAVYWGTQLEDMVAREFMKRTGKKVQRHGMLESAAYPFLLANVDRLVIGARTWTASSSARTRASNVRRRRRSSTRTGRETTSLTATMCSASTT